MRTRLAASLAILLIAAGCNGGDGLTDIGPSVSGQVVDAATGGPVAEATITIGGRMGTSAANGADYIADVPKGNHLLAVTKDGYTEYRQELAVEESISHQTIALVR